MKEFRNILLITDRETDCFEVIRTNAPDSVIKTEVEFFKSCQQFREENLIGKDGVYYPIIKGLGYEVELLHSDQDCKLKEINLNKINQVFDYSNDWVEITVYQHEVCEKELEEAKAKVRELEIANEMLRKAVLQLSSKTKNSDVRVSRKDFVKIHSEAVDYMFDNPEADDNDVYGYEFTVHWHGIYCDCSDGATPSNYLIPGILDCDDELDGEEEVI